MDISGTTVLVSGASSGIGAATARALAANGARVLLLARDRQRLASVESAIRSDGGRADTFVVDLADPGAVAAVAAAVLREVGPPDILIHCAGAGRWLSVAETSASELEQTMALPYFAAFNLTREFLTGMRQRGSGQIVVVTSVASRLTWPGATAYTAARCAMEALSRGLEFELAGSGIKVMLAMFGTVGSDYWVHNPGSEERLPGVASLARTLTPEEAAAAIVSGLQGNRRRVLRPRVFYAIFLLAALFPWVTEWLMRVTGWRSAHSNRPSTEE